MIFALLLFGCADDGSQCEALAAPTRHFESRVLCEAEADLAVLGDFALRADYPTVEARCAPVGLTGAHAVASAEDASDNAARPLRLARRDQPRPR